jgi:DNA repair exonuclease SbcCD ATPase subunit
MSESVSQPVSKPESKNRVNLEDVFCPVGQGLLILMSCWHNLPVDICGERYEKAKTRAGHVYRIHKQEVRAHQERANQLKQEYEEMEHTYEDLRHKHNILEMDHSKLQDVYNEAVERYGESVQMESQHEVLEQLLRNEISDWKEKYEMLFNSHNKLVDKHEEVLSNYNSLRNRHNRLVGQTLKSQIPQLRPIKRKVPDSDSEFVTSPTNPNIKIKRKNELTSLFN